MTADPRESFVEANGLSHHVLEWNPAGERTVVLLHGYLDLAWSFDATARALAESGRRVVAFDWRGHGETEWIGRGGYYHFADYALDLHTLLPELASPPYDVLAHSMGGIVTTLYAGTRPALFRRLVLVEGLGPPSHDPAAAPERFDAWLRTVDAVRKRTRRPMADVHEALARLRTTHPDLPEALGLAIASRATRGVPGGLVFSFDPLHQTKSPSSFVANVFTTFAARITAETLLVDGEFGFRIPEQSERSAAFRSARRAEIAGVGHMLHWHKPHELAALARAFFDAPTAPNEPL